MNIVLAVVWTLFSPFLLLAVTSILFHNEQRAVDHRLIPTQPTIVDMATHRIENLERERESFVTHEQRYIKGEH